MKFYSSCLKRILAPLFLVSLVAFLVLPLCAQSFSKIVAFGDSWSDAGNANVVSNGGALPLLAAPYANGRFTNGFVWVDYLADRLGVQRAVATEVLTQGTNYAYGGAKLDDGIQTGSFWQIPDIGAQVSRYLSGPGPSGSELFTFFGGGNDLASGDSDLSDELLRLKGYIEGIYAAGGREFLIADMPDFGKIAGYTGSTALTSVTNSYNSLLQTELAALRTAYPDAHFFEAGFHGMLDTVYADPAAYGFNPSLKDQSFGEDFVLSDLLWDHRAPVSQYMWIDGIHPTDKLHQLFADAAFSALAVPEISSPLFFLCGGALLFIRKRSFCPLQSGRHEG